MATVIPDVLLNAGPDPHMAWVGLDDRAEHKTESALLREALEAYVR